MSDEKMEQEIVDNGLVYPRITNDEIMEKMKRVKFHCSVTPGTTTTVITAYIMLKHIPFTLATEIMACVDPRNFNKELGEKYGIEKASAAAKNKLWELEGYKLASAIADVPTCHKERVFNEYSELGSKTEKLHEFMMTDTFKAMLPEEKAMMAEQQLIMLDLLKILAKRIAAF